MGDNQNTEKQLYATSDELLINQIASMLTEYEIPFVKRTMGSGAYMSIYMGHTIQEKAIYVNEQEYKKANDLIQSIVLNETEAIEERKELEEYEEDDTASKYRDIKKLFVIVIIGIPIIISIILIITTIIFSILQPISR